MDDFLDDYFLEYKKLAYNKDIYSEISKFRQLALNIRKNGNKLIFAGNGASAAISAHGAVDFTKQGKVRGITFNEADLITCFANDFGYDQWIAEAIKFYADDGDAVVLTSVSGTSANVVNAARTARDMGLTVVTFSGRDESNPLKLLGDINFWVDSHAYNIVECIHMMWMTTVIDCVIGESIYETS